MGKHSLSKSNGAAALYRRRITRTVGAAAGGLLGAAFLPGAVAFADDYDIDPVGTETVTGIYGYGYGYDVEDTAPPAVAGSVQGVQDFDYTDTTTGATGEFVGDESKSTDSAGDGNQEVLVTSSSGTDAPPVGSVFDTYTLDDGSGENIYSAIPSPTGDVVSDTLVTPDGDYTIPTTFDAADVPVADAEGVAIGNGDVIDPVGSEAITAISGIPPLTVAPQGEQEFDVDNAAGTQVGTFDADETTTTDLLGTYTEALLVTSSSDSDIPVGSVFNTIVYGDIENVYSDIPSTTGGADVITDTLDTPLGDSSSPTTFDAADAEVSATVDFPDGAVLAPVSSEMFTGINGLPPGSVGVQAEQVFQYTDGTQVGTFDADVTNTSDAFGASSETILVTKDLTGADVPIVGTTFETVNLGNGFENIYSDTPSTTAGGDVISDTFVTPFGDFTIPPSFDAAAGLASDLFAS